MKNDKAHLEDLHRLAVAAYRAGERDPDALTAPADGAFLASIGLSAQVLFDYAEDFVRSDEPDCATFVRAAGIRRDFFHGARNSVPAARTVREDELPLREHEWEGIAWLPRIAAKARCFLEGSLCREVMYGCSGDRAFLRKYNLSLPDFLAAVRDSEDHRKTLPRLVRAGSPPAQ
ncbi:MAG: hypothetical protein WCS31_02025 [Verrucomicrobiae bacterium]